MESQNGYFNEDITVDSETERILHSGRASSRRKFVTNGNSSCSDKKKKIKSLQSSGNTMRDPVKTKKNMDYDKNSDSYYSDDYDDSSYTSAQYYSETSRSRTPSPKRKGQAKQKSLNPNHNQANGKSSSRQAANRGGRCWGSCTQSLNKETVHKEVDLVTKRMLSARLLKINELRNEVTELQAKLEDLQKENKILKRLQYRQERALNKFEDTENEISMLISRHNDEVRVLRERLRKSQEKERAVEKRLKDTEEELYRTRSSLQKLKKLSEDKHLVERDELAQKLAKAEVKMEESERKLKELEKNLGLTNNSFLRQVASERKKAHVAQENIQNLQETIQHLNHKLKGKEKELDIKNIYANRILKASPKKDTESIPKKKATVPNTVKEVQTEEYFLPLELPTPPLVFSGEEELKNKGEFSQTVQEHQDNETLEWTDRPRRDKELQVHEKACEEMLKREHEQQKLELKAQRLKEKWEREELERKKEEKERREKETSAREDEHQNVAKIDERRKKDILLAKMREIDEEANGSSLFSPHDNTLSPFSTEMLKSCDSPERLQKTNDFLKSVENTPTEGYGRRSTRTTDFSDELSFGTYAPSFGKGIGRSGLIEQKGNGKEEQMNGHHDLLFKDRKSNLMDQLFGSGTATGFASKEEKFAISPAVDKSKWDNNPFPWEKTSIPLKKNDNGDSILTDGIISSNHHYSKYTSIKPAVKAIDSLEDEIEEVVL